MVSLFTEVFHLLKVSLFNSLSNDKILDWPKLKAFADDKMNLNEQLKFGFRKVENIVGNGENAGSHNVFKRLLPQGRWKSGLCGKNLKHNSVKHTKLN